jgi:hypothetical protein
MCSAIGSLVIAIKSGAKYGIHEPQFVVFHCKNISSTSGAYFCRYISSHNFRDQY